MRPDSVHLNLHRVGMGAITTETVKSWHADLHKVAEAIKEVDAPQKKLELSELEVAARKDPARLRRIGYKIALVLVAVIFIVAVCAGGLGVVLAFSTS